MNGQAFRLRVPLLSFLVAAGTILVVWLVRQALAPFFLAMVLAYLQEPAVAWLSRRMKRERAAALVICLVLSVLALVLWTAIPRLVAQGERLVATVPVWKAALDVHLKPWLEAHPAIQARIQQGLDGVDPMLFVRGILGTGRSVLAWLLEGMSFLLVPVMVYYLLAEGPEFRQAVDGLIPPRYAKQVRSIAAEIHGRLGGYIRGQIAMAVAMSLLQGLGFWVVGVPYAWLLGLLAGVANVIPFATYVVGFLPALLVLALGGASWLHLGVMALVFFGVQMLEALYFTPVWLGRASRLHPLEVLLATLGFGFAFGVLGLVFAVPLMIVAKVVYERLVAGYKQHPWFHGVPPGEDA